MNYRSSQQFRAMIIWILPFISAVLLIFCFPRFEQGYLGWIAFLPLFNFFNYSTPRRSFWGGFICGFIFQLYLNLYVGEVLVYYLAPTLGAVLVLLMVGLLSLAFALFGCLFTMLKRRLPTFLFALATPAMWVLLEYLRSITFLGYTVGFIGYSQWKYPFILRLASVYGYWGLAFFMLFFQVVLFLFWKEKKRQETLAATIVFCILFFAGLFLPSLYKVEPAQTPLHVALLQGNIPQERILDPGEAVRTFKKYKRMSREAAKSYADLDLLVWPETVVSLKLQRKRPALEEMKSLAEEIDTPILYGAMVETVEEEKKTYNAVYLEIPGQKSKQFYYKQRLVPFAEYFPLAGVLDRLIDLNMRLGHYTPGAAISLFTLDELRLSAVVCFESYFGDLTRRFAALGSRHMFTLTNDAWFNESIGLDQHAQIGAIRAAEMGTGFTQVANTGITISFDYLGREIFRAPLMEEQTFFLELDLTRQETIYQCLGDFLIWCSFLYLGAISIYIFSSAENLN
ncbi:MAG: apolipoprotein N-acyltransferase [Dethiobacteria bacterium]|nr:apolipoprotein N-acyltransferase [Bacillota bacterium]